MKETINQNILDTVFPLHIGESEAEEVATLLEAGETIPSEIVEGVINGDIQ